ncbi:UNVERIFIED_CONTAM: hypothetical protein NCL1_33559 [Trichonephila clavipes]
MASNSKRERNVLNIETKIALLNHLAMACNAEDSGFQMLNDVEIVTSVQEESNPVNDETDEDEDNKNNENNKGSSNANAFSVFETAMERYEQQSVYT